MPPQSPPTFQPLCRYGISRHRGTCRISAARQLGQPGDVSLTPDLWRPMPDTMTPAVSPALPQFALQPHGVWSALRTKFLEDKPGPGCVRPVRTLLTHLYETGE